MQIKFDLKIFLFILFFFLSKQIEIYFLLMLFATLHEMGHMLTGIVLGLRPKRLDIMPLGLKISFKIDMNNYNKRIANANLLTLKKLIITIAGPMVNVIFIILLILVKKKEILNIKSEILIYTNLLIFLFNMLIIYPLDGGRILKYILCIIFGRYTALKATNAASKIVVLFLGISCIYISFKTKNFLYLIVLFYILVMVIRENNIYRIKIKMYKTIKDYKKNHKKC